MPAQALIQSLDLARRRTLALVADLTDEQLTAQPASAENHPAWTLGHLFLLDAYLADFLEPDDAPTLDERWVRVYGPDSMPSADASVYMTKAELLERLDTVRAVVIGAIAALPDEALMEELPEHAPGPELPSYHHLILHALWHEGYHAGQLAAWRRAMGLPAPRGATIP
jgi:uncharacterized damage-inducible protein DinB